MARPGLEPGTDRADGSVRVPWVPDLSKIHRVLGWAPTHSLDASINDVIEHYRSGNTPL